MSFISPTRDLSLNRPITISYFMKTILKAAPITAAFLLATGSTTLFVTSCEQKKTLGDKVDDALDNRSNEKAKDKAEDVGDAVKDAAGDVKDAAKDATN